LLIIFLTVAQAEEGVGHIEPVKVVLEQIGFGAVGGVVAGALGAWILRSFGAAAGWRRPGGRSTQRRHLPAVRGGAAGPALGELDWRIAAYALASLTVVRMLPVALAMAGTGMRRATVGFLGWFGPRGLASIVFLLILLEKTELPERPLMAAVVTWTVALSVYAHGLTAGPAATRYADWYDAPPSSIVSCPRVPSWPSNALAACTPLAARSPVIVPPDSGRKALDHSSLITPYG
jgi:sodium/hydrogen antiporter